MERDILERLYVQDRLSYREIAEHTGLSSASIYRWVKKFDLVGKRNTVDDLKGKVFGKLTVNRYIRTGRYPNGGIYHVWECQCECGKLVSVRSGNLKSGQQTCKNCVADVVSNKLRTLPFDYKIWFRIVDRCQRKGLELSVDPDYLFQLFRQQNGRCALTGVEIAFGKSTHDSTTASPDRIDPKIGYVAGNIQWVHKVINSMRNSMSVKEFQDWCKLVCDFKTPA